MAVRRRDIDRQRDAVLVDRNMDLDAPDLLAAIDATLTAARRRATGATVDHHGARLRRIAASLAPAAAQPVEQAAPQAKPGPAREQCSRACRRGSRTAVRSPAIACRKSRHTRSP